MNVIALRLHDPLQRFAVVSAGLHLFIFAANNFFGVFYSRPQFAVEIAPTSIDVMIIEEIRPMPKETPIPVPEPAQAVSVPQEKIPDLPQEIPEPVASDLFQGTLAEAKPDYLRNPAPVYPWEARWKGWEGVVVLTVSVSRLGMPLAVGIEQSSGRAVLDEAAVKTIRTWQFSPATVGSIPIESSVRVPVRFELKDAKHF